MQSQFTLFRYLRYSLVALGSVLLASVLAGCLSVTERESCGYTVFTEVAAGQPEILKFSFHYITEAEIAAMDKAGCRRNVKKLPLQISWEGDSYSLLYAPDNLPVCTNIYYVKTFGGQAQTVEVYLIDRRFVAYPATVQDSRINGELFYDMLAVTHVYDLQRRKEIYVSAPYRYNHDIPVVVPACILL
jgi:hypothetical protein